MKQEPVFHLLVMWQGEIMPKVSEALISQVDIMASLAALTNQLTPKSDSRNLLDVMLGKSNNGRTSLVMEGLSHKVALRKGDWVFIPAYEGGKKPNWGVDAETGFSLNEQLFNIKKDPKQVNNLASKYSQKVEEMKKLLIEVKNEGVKK